MALTDNCDVFVGVNEAALNRLVTHVFRQRPSLVNIGSPSVVANPDLLCSSITPAHPVVVQRKNPLVKLGPDLPVAGTPLLMEYAFQLAAAEVDIHKNDIVTLPPELSPMRTQSMAVHARVCAGLGCPGDRIDVGRLPTGPIITTHVPKPPRKIFVPFRELECFCLDLFVALGADFAGPAGDQHLLGRLDGLEIVDLAPTGLEDAIECYAKLAIQFGLLPQLALPVIFFSQGVPGVATISVEPTVPPAVANNPALEDDTLKLFLDVNVGPAPPPGPGGGGGGGSAPPTFPGSPRARTRTGPFDAQAALSEDAVEALFTAVRDGFSFNETVSGSFGPFSASATAAGHLENGTIDLKANNSIAIDELDLQFDILRACIGLDIPEICVGGFCILGIPFDGCAIRLPEICIFSANPDIQFCLDIAPFVRFELSAAVRPIMKYSVNPGRLPGMNDWDAHDAMVPNHWQLYLDPLTIDLDLFDFADAIGDLLDDALDAALDTILGPLPQWAKDLIKAILGPIIDVVRAILDFGDDFVEWLSQLIGVSLGLGNLILQLIADYLASGHPLFEFPDPIQVMPAAPGPLMPVLVPLEFIDVHTNADELVLDADVGDSL
jgi:hypothetical protein